MSPSINASQLPVQVSEELTALEDARWRRQEAVAIAKTAAKATGTPGTSSKPAQQAAKSPAPPKPKLQPRNTVAKKPPTSVVKKPASPPATPSLPDGYVAFSPSEQEAIDDALAYYVQHHPAFKR